MSLCGKEVKGGKAWMTAFVILQFCNLLLIEKGLLNSCST